MKLATWIALSLLALVGCVREPRAVVLRAAERPRPYGHSVTNLALGPTAEHALTGELFGRSDTWAAIGIGYRLGDAAFFQQILYDDQAFYDELGGGFYQSRESSRSGALLR